MKTTYHIYHAPDGGGETYLGETTSLRTARQWAAQYRRGQRAGLEESLYGTAVAAGHVDGYEAPDKTVEVDGEPCRWFGHRGEYCAVALIAPPLTGRPISIYEGNV